MRLQIKYIILTYQDIPRNIYLGHDQTNIQNNQLIHSICYNIPVEVDGTIHLLNFKIPNSMVVYLEKCHDMIDLQCSVTNHDMVWEMCAFSLCCIAAVVNLSLPICTSVLYHSCIVSVFCILHLGHQLGHFSTEDQGVEIRRYFSSCHFCEIKGQ